MKNFTKLLGFIHMNLKPVFITEEDKRQITDTTQILHPSFLGMHIMHIDII